MHPRSRVTPAPAGVIVLAAFCLAASGCQDPGDLLAQALGFSAAVSAQMQARGWQFPANPLDLARYTRDLAASVEAARAGATNSAVRTAGAKPVPAPPDLRNTFHAPR